MIVLYLILLSDVSLAFVSDVKNGTYQCSSIASSHAWKEVTFELSKFSTSGGTLKFTRLIPNPEDVLAKDCVAATEIGRVSTLKFFPRASYGAGEQQAAKITPEVDDLVEWRITARIIDYPDYETNELKTNFTIQAYEPGLDSMTCGFATKLEACIYTAPENQ